jgi:hypothetical protein
MSDKEETKTEEAAASATSESNSPAKAKATVGLQHIVVPTEHCGSFNIYVQVETFGSLPRIGHSHLSKLD